MSKTQVPPLLLAVPHLRGGARTSQGCERRYDRYVALPLPPLSSSSISPCFGACRRWRHRWRHVAATSTSGKREPRAKGDLAQNDVVLGWVFYFLEKLTPAKRRRFGGLLIFFKRCRQNDVFWAFSNQNDVVFVFEL